MKGGKGGQGRKPSRTAAKPKGPPRDGPKRGTPKKDWGAVETPAADQLPKRR